MEENYTCYLGSETDIASNIFRTIMFFGTLTFFQYFIFQGSSTIFYWIPLLYVADKWRLIWKRVKS